MLASLLYNSPIAMIVALPLIIALGIIVDFERSSYSVEEDDVSVEVCVIIVNGTLERSITLSLSANNGTALGIKKVFPFGS